MSILRFSPTVNMACVLMLAKALHKENLSQGVPVHGFPNPPGFAVGKIVFTHGPNYRGRLGMDNTAQPIWALFKPTKESNRMVTPVCIVDWQLSGRASGNAENDIGTARRTRFPSGTRRSRLWECRKRHRHRSSDSLSQSRLCDSGRPW